MTQEPFKKDDNGNRVFVVDPDAEIVKVDGGCIVNARSYTSTSGKRSKYPIILMGVGDKVFVPNGKANTKDLVYLSAVNRRSLDPSFHYVAYTSLFQGTHGLMIRCVERK